MPSKRPLSRILAVLLFFGLVAAVLAGTLGSAFLKRRVLAGVQSVINDSIVADVRINDASLTVFSSFPNLKLNLSEVTVTNRAPFAGVTLAKVEQIKLTLDLMSVVSGGVIKVRGIEVDNAMVNMRVDEEGHSNTEITVPSNSKQPSKPMALALSGIVLDGVDLRYHTPDTDASLDDLSFRGNGDFVAASSALSAHAEVPKLTVKKDGVSWVDDAKISWDVIGKIEQGKETTVSFTQNRLTLNAFHLDTTGTVATVNDDLNLNLSIRSAEGTIKDLLSLIPSLYKGNYEKMVSSGVMSLSGTVSGILPAKGDGLPAFDLLFSIMGGNFSMPNVPGVSGLEVNAHLTKPAGSADLTTIDVPTFAFSMDGSPLQGSLSLRTPVSDPDLKLRATGQLDLQKIQKLAPQPGRSLSGTLGVDVDVAGKVSQFSGQGIENVKATGRVSANGLSYTGSEVPDPVEVSRLSATLSPAHVEVSEASLKIGASDFSVRATLDNVVGYLLADKTLGGSFELTSNFVDVDALKGEPEASTGTEESSVYVIPANLDLRASTQIRRLRYGEKDYQDVRGNATVKDGVLTMQDITMSLLGGRATVNGTYAAKTSKAADVNLKMGLSDISVLDAAANYETLARIVPIAKGLGGRMSGSADLQTRLGPTLSPDLPTLFSKGNLRFANVALVPAALATLGTLLQDERFRRLDFDGRSLSYLLEGGKLAVDRTSVRVGGVEATLLGNAGVLDQKLDFDLNLLLPVNRLGSLLSQIPGATGNVDVVAHIGGSYDNPKVTVAPGKVTGGIVDAAVSQLVEEANKRGDQLIAAAEQQGDQLRQEAKKQAAALKAEAKKQADKQVAAAKGNPVLQAAAKKAGEALVQKADDAGKKLEKEADKKADALVDAAKKEKNRLVAEAQKKAGG